MSEEEKEVPAGALLIGAQAYKSLMYLVTGVLNAETDDHEEGVVIGALLGALSTVLVSLLDYAESGMTPESGAVLRAGMVAKLLGVDSNECKH